MVAILIELRIPPDARNGTLIYPAGSSGITHFFVPSILDRILLEGLISDALQVIHKGLLIGQHVVHVTVLAPLNL